MVRFVASYLIWILFIGICFLFFKEKKKRKQILYIFFVTIIVWAISEMIKAIIPSTRPFLENGRGIKTLTLHFDSSFPSTHSAIAFGLATAVYYFDKNLGRVYVMGAVLVALGRYLANVHYVFDVAVGALIGISVVFLINKYKIFKI